MYEGEMCEQCSTMEEGEQCEQCGSSGMSYTMEELEESIVKKSNAKLINEQVEDSLNWFKRFKNY
jgi:methionyl-tRNA synthetase